MWNSEETLRTPLYFDSAASGRPHPHLAEWMAEMQPFYFYNPHGGTCYAEECRKLIVEAERELLSLLGVLRGRVIWTSGITEALNLAVASCQEQRIFLDSGAHSALSQPVEQRRRKECRVERLSLNGQGMIQGSSQDAGTLCFSLVNNETGAIQPLQSLRERFPRCRWVMDAAQAFCKIPLTVPSETMVALSSRKIGGPAAVGALVVPEQVALSPQMIGGGQQKGIRGGTMDAMGISLFVRVAKERMATLQAHQTKIRQLNRFFWEALAQARLPKYWRISPEEGAAPDIAMFAIPNYEGALISRILAEREAILLSSSAACSAETGKVSQTLVSMGFSEQVARCAVRVSFDDSNTLDEVKQLIAALERTIEFY